MSERPAWDDPVPRDQLRMIVGLPEGPWTYESLNAWWLDTTRFAMQIVRSDDPADQAFVALALEHAREGIERRDRE